jgi:hypothetical protein
MLVGVREDSTRSHLSDTSSVHKTRVYHRLGLDHGGERETRQWQAKNPELIYQPNMMMMRMSGGMTGRHNEKRKEKYKEALRGEYFDVDGDGMIDEWEIKMGDVFRKMRYDDIEDMNGDGNVDEDDLRMARERQGKKMIAREFLENLEAPLWKYDKRYRGMSVKDVHRELINASDFAKAMNTINRKERLYRLSSSHLVTDSIHAGPQTTRFEDRNLSARGFFKEDRNRRHNKQLLEATSKVVQNQPFNRDHGDIASYGNFSNYKGICVLQGINLAATGHS